jgi:predicted O-methyltransferase YrrM
METRVPSFLLTAVLFSHSCAVVSSQDAQDPFSHLPDPKIVSLLKSVWGKAGRMNIAPQEGRFLHDLIIENDLKAGLEIGTSNGYSALWLGMAFRQTGGRLTTIEYNKTRGREALANFKQAGLQDRIDMRMEDATKTIPTLMGPFDFVFIDAWKEDYEDYLEMVLPKVRPGGIITAHNVSDQRSRMAGFIRAITHNPQLDTEFAPISRSGLSVSRKIK